METDKVLQALEKLSEKLEISSDKLFSYYVKNVKLYRIYFCIELLFSIIALIVGIFLVNYNHGKLEDYTVMQGSWLILGAIIGLFGLIGTITVCFNFPKVISSILNPEYDAIEDLFASLFSN